MGSLNMNGGRDRVKRARVSEIIRQKSPIFCCCKKHILTLITKSSGRCGGKGSLCSAPGQILVLGSLFFFPHSLKIKIISTKEIVKGRAVMVKVEIEDNVYIFS